VKAKADLAVVAIAAAIAAAAFALAVSVAAATASPRHLQHYPPVNLFFLVLGLLLAWGRDASLALAWVLWWQWT